MDNFSKKQIGIIIIIATIFFIVIGGYLYNVYSKDSKDIFIEEEIETPLAENYKQNSIDGGKVIVHIAGEVNSPGIVEVNSGSRIADIIENANGFTENADISKVNLAYTVQDGQKITIPSIENEGDETVENSTENLGYISQENGKNIIEESGAKENDKNNIGILNINRATQTELEQLPGIGPSTALKIIEYRKTNKFNKIEDIKNVNGIGEAKFEKIKNYIMV